jgi:hypothetical protein
MVLFWVGCRFLTRIAGSSRESFSRWAWPGGGEQICGRARRNSLAIPARPARPACPACPGNPHEIPPLTRLPCHVNVTFYREESL